MWMHEETWARFKCNCQVFSSFILNVYCNGNGCRFSFGQWSENKTTNNNSKFWIDLQQQQQQMGEIFHAILFFSHFEASFCGLLKFNSHLHVLSVLSICSGILSGAVYFSLTLNQWPFIVFLNLVILNVFMHMCDLNQPQPIHTHQKPNSLFT